MIPLEMNDQLWQAVIVPARDERPTVASRDRKGRSVRRAVCVWRQLDEDLLPPVVSFAPAAASTRFVLYKTSGRGRSRLSSVPALQTKRCRCGRSAVGVGATRVSLVG